ncbi:hypothetical protein [Luteolibacter sp. LG18]|uniref:hypothetical protein n=1 Tax=Luteolibacter sp. LG18 TaxID=2819286 RepID=UPI002B2BCA36|nr:hypothetical protein llg_00560 [Luteolibacter sp. LG18]
MKSTHLLLRGVCLAFGCTGISSGATLLTNEGFTTNNQLFPGGATYGSNASATTSNWTVTTGIANITGTPDIQVAWSSTATGNSGIGFDTFANFTTHGKVIQLDGTGGGAQPQFQILFTPTAGSSAYLQSFDLISGNTAAKSVSWSLSGTTSGTIASGLWTANSDIQQTISVAAGGTTGEALTLLLTGTTGPTTFLGFDNLSYDQVPEPGAAGLAALAGCGWLLKRRR